MESAGITLLSGDLMGIVRARKLARATLRNIKQAQIITLLQRPKGICIAEIVAVTGWQAHTASGVMSGALKKNLGLVITSQWKALRGSVYRIGRCWI